MRHEGIPHYRSILFSFLLPNWGGEVNAGFKLTHVPHTAPLQESHTSPQDCCRKQYSHL